mgnify:CR=1 FL=1
MNTLGIDSTARSHELGRFVRAWPLRSINHCYYVHFLAVSRLVDIAGAGAAQRPADSDPSHMLKEGPDGFEGSMSVKKYMTITGASKAMAARDLQDLAEKHILVPTGGGRSTHYKIDL